VDKTTIRGAPRSVLFTKYYWSDQIKKNEIGEACSSNEEKGGAYRV
jgi:hypothetical protein